jgi:hypothetical protein
MHGYESQSYIYIRTSPCCKFPLLALFLTYLAPSSCDRNRPPRSQVARKLLPFVPHCSLVPSPPKSQPFSDFPEPNVHLIKAHLKPSSQYPEHCLHRWSQQITAYTPAPHLSTACRDVPQLDCITVFVRFLSGDWTAYAPF